MLANHPELGAGTSFYPAIRLVQSLKAAKTAFQGKGRVQHVCVKEPAFIQFLERILAGRPPDEPIYAGSACAFRRRWDHILSVLQVLKSAKLVPGGLRGGGAIRQFRSAAGLQELMWKMRLRHVATLECYVQEAAAISVLPALTAESRSKISAASILLEATWAFCCAAPRESHSTSSRLWPPSSGGFPVALDDARRRSSFLFATHLWASAAAKKRGEFSARGPSQSVDELACLDMRVTSNLGWQIFWALPAWETIVFC